MRGRLGESGTLLKREGLSQAVHTESPHAYCLQCPAAGSSFSRGRYAAVVLSGHGLPAVKIVLRVDS
jgi:hypothetical protein